MLLGAYAPRPREQLDFAWKSSNELTKQLLLVMAEHAKALKDQGCDIDQQRAIIANGVRTARELFSCRT